MTMNSLLQEGIRRSKPRAVSGGERGWINPSITRGYPEERSEIFLMTTTCSFASELFLGPKLSSYTEMTMNSLLQEGIRRSKPRAVSGGECGWINPSITRGYPEERSEMLSIGCDK
ncbi:hypothetical protein RB195_007286 [Necator americanus]|uniref:Uncharacterized protein n=1 Tax=Necator americanus TaxID=51031 RepID=A0ABR1BZJ2_NECAM